MKSLPNATPLACLLVFRPLGNRPFRWCQADTPDILYTRSEFRRAIRTFSHRYRSRRRKAIGYSAILPGEVGINGPHGEAPPSRRRAAHAPYLMPLRVSWCRTICESAGYFDIINLRVSASSGSASIIFSQSNVRTIGKPGLNETLRYRDFNLSGQPACDHAGCDPSSAIPCGPR